MGASAGSPTADSVVGESEITPTPASSDSSPSAAQGSLPGGSGVRNEVGQVKMPQSSTLNMLFTHHTHTRHNLPFGCHLNFRGVHSAGRWFIKNLSRLLPSKIHSRIGNMISRFVWGLEFSGDTMAQVANNGVHLWYIQK